MKTEVRGRKGNGRKGGERPKGGGTLEERKRKGWVARWTVDGKRFSKLIGKVSRAEAEKALADIVAPFRVRDEVARAEMIAGRLQGARERLKRLEESRPALSLDDAFEVYLDSPERPNTAGASQIEYLRGHFRLFRDFMRENYPAVEEMREVTHIHADSFARGEWARKVAPATYNAFVCEMSAIWRVLRYDDNARISQNPWERIRPRRLVQVRRRELTIEELARVCASLTGEYRVLFAMGIYTGLRLSDCALMEWGCVDLARGMITVTPRKTAHKTGQTVFIPIHRVLRDIFCETGSAARVGYVLPRLAAQYKKNHAYVIRKIQRLFRAVGIETNGEKRESGRRSVLVGFHSLRHTFVSMCANAGVPLAIVQAIVGHSSVDMTRHYFHGSEHALQAAITAIPAIGDGGAVDIAELQSGTRLDGIKARIRELSEDERADLADWIARGAL